MTPFDFLVLSAPTGRVDAGPAIAASRAGAIGVLDLDLAQSRGVAVVQLERLCRAGTGRRGVLLDGDGLLAEVLAERPRGLEVIVTSAEYSGALHDLVAAAHERGVRVLATATSVPQALSAQTAGVDGVIAKGHEAAGWVGEEGSLILLQRLVAALDTPIWAHGGIGLRTVACAAVAGAAGAVLDGQLLLARESPLPEDLLARVASMDGSETTVLGAGLGAGLRMAAQPGAPAAAGLREAQARLEVGDDAEADVQADWRAAVGDAVAGGALVVGQDAAFAAELARRFETIGGILGGLRAAVQEATSAVAQDNPLGEGSALARSHGTRYPIVQGPMTRVSDRAEFAAAVAVAGALPFLALALLRGPEVDELLRDTAALAGEHPWGVGILGFVPAELRAEQLEVVRAHRPPFALIAGGRPDQARELEAEGITTYLHVPSPGLLELYLADGARHFVFEGRECGGHVGPRTSFVLWDTMLGKLEEALGRDAADCHVLLAGGIHDARSAAMAAAAAAPVAARGVRVGALLGTGYLFTREATECGAITETFQEAAVAGTSTALVESGPGHATRCLPSPFVDQFNAEKRRLRAEGVAAGELRDSLEALNVGRLRIASKGTDRHPRHGEDPAAPKLANVDPAQQWERGMFMIGQVAALRDSTTTLADLHRDVSAGSTEMLAAVDMPATDEPTAPAPADVAIIGLGCILPGAPDVATLWDNILNKVDAVGEIPAERWDWRRYYDPDPAAPDKVYSRWGGFIDEVDLDPMALGLPPASLRSIEPFQLLALVTAQAALRDAGYATRPFDRERTSVILGAGGGGADLSVGYTVRSAVPQLLGDAAPEVQEHLNDQLPVWTEDSFAGLLMNVAAGRIANRLDFGGANYTVDAACASSLAALSAGVGELRAGTSDVVLAGGVDAIQNPFAYLCFSKTHALSPTGRCRPFDAAADGIAISEGFATVVLKRLADAERDGDRIYAVVRGVGAASDGRDRSLTAPRPEGQMRALRRAFAQAGFSPESVELVEAHGTGTVAGDAAEIEALSRQFSAHSDATQWCAIGSVKSMIGHTKATAGVAGLVKTALALHHRVLPPTIGVTEPNPKAGFETSPFYVNSEARPWVREEGAHPRRAGVSAFGFGGTDFHAVLEEYTGERLGPPTSAIDHWPAELLLWRGSREAITADVEALAARLDAGALPALADLALTLAHEANAAEAPGEGVATLAVVAESLDDLRAKLPALREVLAGDAASVHAPNGMHFSARPLAAEGRVAFLFPGQGSQAVDMARDIAMAFPEALACFGLADRVLAGRFDRPLSRFVFPPPTFTPEDAEQRRQELTRTDVAQPALGAAELAYLRVLDVLGVHPEMAAGHSYGEFVALAAAGCLGEEDLMRLSDARGTAMAEASAEAPGAMAAVQASSEALEELLAAGDIVVANRNAPEQTVVSGPADRIEAAVAWCAERDITARRLPVACAFHSPLVASAQRRVADALQATPLAPPRIPVYSNTTGGRHADDPTAIAGVLSEHLARPVEFVREIDSMHEDGARLFVEVGPGSVLTGLVGRILGDREHVAVSVDRSRRSGLVPLLHALAALAAEGVPVRAERLFEGRSASPFALASLKPDEGADPPRPGLWKVNGGRARPADAPPPSIPPSLQRPPELQEQPAMTIHTNGGAPAVVAPPPPAAPPPSPAPMTLDAPPAAAHPPDGVGQVMARYQDVMQHFIETQRSVMLAYLGAPRPAASSSGAPPMRPAAPATVARTLEAAPSAAPAPPAAAIAPPAPAAPPPAPVPTPAPAPVAEAKVPATSETNGHVAVTREEIRTALLDVVCERTGYPADMLDLEADLEGDLGIDSIKRVEIAGTLTQTLLKDVPVDIEKVTASKTLAEVIGALEDAVAQGAASTNGAATRPFDAGPAEQERIGRFVLQSESAPPIAHEAGLATGGSVVVLDDGAGTGEALAAALIQRGETVVNIAPADAPRDAESAVRLVARLRDDGHPPKALVHLTAPGQSAAGDAGLAPLLVVLQAMADDLGAAAATGGAAVVAGCRLDGAFGVQEGPPDDAAAQGAPVGLIKSLAQEWPAVRMKAVDLGRSAPPEAAAHLLAELAADDGIIEVGYRDGQRTTVTLAPAPLKDRPDADLLGDDAVVLVTGGARGITAQVALALAEHHKPRLVLVGRTEPRAEDDGTAGLTDLPALREWFIEDRRRGDRVLTPALVEADCRSLLQAREVHDTLDRIRASGASVEYLACDVSDPEAFGALIDGVYAAHGRIDGVIHGAGVIEDRLLGDKTVDSLERVLTAKAGAAATLARRLRPEGLEFLVLFSSVSGRFGNRGQSDYAAASEILNKLAQELDRRWPARVVAIDWGPWRAGGMVSPEVEREFARRGVALITPETGCRMLLEELHRGRKGEAELVIGGATGPDGARSDAATLPLLAGRTQGSSSPEGGVELLLTLALDYDRYLDHHRVDGRAVLPFAVAMELMAETALTANPKAHVTGLRDIRLLHGVTVDDETGAAVRITAPPRTEGGDVTVTITAAEGARAQYRAVVELDRARAAAEPGPMPLTELAPFPLSVPETYDELLFHGPLFQRIAAITGMDDRGSTALLTPSAPAECVAGAAGHDWLLDPILLDAALQVQVIWARLYWDVTLLPAEIGGYHRVTATGAAPLAGPLRHELRIRPHSRPPLCHADHWFYGPDGTLIATLTDVVGAGSRALNRLTAGAA